MSDYERSYYEIALTNGQVLAVFGVLLAVVFGAFVSGMWVARRALAEDAPQQIAAVGVESGSEASEQVQFFEKPSTVRPATDGNASANQAAAEAASAERQQQGAPAVSGRQGSDSFEPDAPPPEAAARQAERAAEAARAEEARQEAEARAEREAAAARTPEVDTPRVSDLPVIQVLSSGDETQAQQLVGRLKGAGHRAFISPVQVDGRTMYRVRVGPFSDRPQAEEEATKLKSAFKLDTWITTN